MERLTFIVVAVGAYIVFRIARIGRREAGLPPGPPTKPVLGNLLEIPPRYAHLYFASLKRTYGDVSSLKLFGHTMIILNSCQAVVDLLDKRSGSFNDRAPAYINDELIAKKHHALLADGKTSIIFRRLFSKTLGPGVVNKHVALQEAESAAVMRNILNRPGDWHNELRRYTCSLTLSIAFGKRAPTFSGVDKAGFSVARFYELARRFSSFLEVGAAPPIDLLPIFKYIPERFAPWKVQARQLHEEMKHFYVQVLFEDLKSRIAAGQVTDCWMKQLIEENSENLIYDRLAWTSGVMMEGGSDTTAGALLVCVLAAAAHPEAVQRAQSELDMIIGQDRMPNINDLTNLPYCSAFIKELQRWRPVAPAGVPHLSTQQETYRGYVIPKGSIVIFNTWGINRDPEMFDEPDKFKPERFIAHPFGLKPHLGSEGWKTSVQMGFGAGRRVCLGQTLTENSLALLVPRMLQAFSFQPKKGEVDVNNFEPGHLTAPVHFDCDLVPRNGRLAQLIRNEYENQLDLLEKLAP